VIGRGQYSRVGGMIAYLLTDHALGTGGSHGVSTDLPPNIEAAVMLI
jgi:hypothetical protein